MLDDGFGPAVYDALSANYAFPDTVRLLDAGCMTMDLLPCVRDNDCLIVVDAVDGTGLEPGTLVRFHPGDIADHGQMQSLHDLRFIDLLNAAALLGYEAQGIGFGVQVENKDPYLLTEGLTQRVHASVPLAVDAVLAELWRLGVRFCHADGRPFEPPRA